MRKFQSLLFVLKRSYICYHINCVRPATLLKKRLWRRCFPVNFEKFLRAIFSQNISGRLILHNNNLNFSTWVFFYGCWILHLIRFCQWIITNDMVNWCHSFYTKYFQRDHHQYPNQRKIPKTSKLLCLLRPALFKSLIAVIFGFDLSIVLLWKL